MPTKLLCSFPLMLTGIVNTPCRGQASVAMLHGWYFAIVKWFSTILFLLIFYPAFSQKDSLFKSFFQNKRTIELRNEPSVTVQEFYWEGMFEFPDTIRIHQNFESLKPKSRHCRFERIRGNLYRESCLHGSPGIEDPTIFRQNLRIKNKGSYIILKWGMKRKRYTLAKIADNLLLIARQ
jgi:hypothetical protein